MIEIFARLNAKTATFKPSGNTPLLDVTDLCGVLASLKEQHSWYVYALINQRRSYNMELLHVYCQQSIMQEMRSRNFKSSKGAVSDIAYGITKAAIYAHFHPKGTCATCNGLGFKNATKCEPCNGKGIKEHKWSERVIYGFPLRKDLSRHWYAKVCERYDRLVESMLLDIQVDLVSALEKVNRQAIAYRREENKGLFDEP